MTFQKVFDNERVKDARKKKQLFFKLPTTPSLFLYFIFFSCIISSQGGAYIHIFLTVVTPLFTVPPLSFHLHERLIVPNACLIPFSIKIPLSTLLRLEKLGKGLPQ